MKNEYKKYGIIYRVKSNEYSFTSVIHGWSKVGNGERAKEILMEWILLLDNKNDDNNNDEQNYKKLMRKIKTMRSRRSYNHLVLWRMIIYFVHCQSVSLILLLVLLLMQESVKILVTCME